jgi:hypothetical protein
MNIHFNNTRPANAPAATLFEVITDYPRDFIVERIYEGHILGPDPLGQFTPWTPPLHCHDCRGTKQGASARAGNAALLEETHCGINLTPFTHGADRPAQEAKGLMS